ncbi:hypothetical protein BC332_11908 [Capsicum chinense]|nr:hypothetical protein BC332_11908 [Capsicum chinense]
MVKIEIYKAEDGFITLNLGIPSRRVISTGAKVTKRSDVVIDDIGYIPRQRFKWKGKSAITNSKLEKMGLKRLFKRGLQLLPKHKAKIFQQGKLM